MKRKYMMNASVEVTDAVVVRAKDIVEKNGGEWLGWRKSNTGKLQFGFVATPKAKLEIETCLSITRIVGVVKDYGNDDGTRKPSAPKPVTPKPEPAPTPACVVVNSDDDETEEEEEKPKPQRVRKVKASAPPVKAEVEPAETDEPKPNGGIETLEEVRARRYQEHSPVVIKVCKSLGGTPDEWCDAVGKHFGYFSLDRMKLYFWLERKCPKVSAEFPRSTNSYRMPIITAGNLRPYLTEVLGNDAEAVLNFI